MGERITGGFAGLAGFDVNSGKIDENKKKQFNKERQEKEREQEKKKNQNFQRMGNKPAGGGNYGNQKKPRYNDGYVGAPYNFVPMWEKTAELTKEELISHREASENLLSGAIRYRIEAETPIMIDDGKGKFYKDLQGRHAIPGSSLCGLIRSNAQVLSQSSLADDIDDYALMYREVGGAKGASRNKQIYDDTLGSGIITQDGKQLSILKNVKAGYLRNENGNYVIYHTKPDKINQSLAEMNYYVLSERRIMNNRKDFAIFFPEGRSILQHLPGEFRKEVRNGRIHYKGIKNNAYKPYMMEVSFELTNERFVTKVGKPGIYSQKGWAVSSGFMNEKKALYIVPEIDEDSEPVQIPSKDVAAYQIDYTRKENQLGKDKKNYWQLPNKGQTKPVFYIALDRVYFGFTPRLRLFYTHTIHDGLGSGHQSGMIDFAKSLFGYSNKKESYKSRLSFSDAVVVENAVAESEKKMILGEPKPTSYADYLSKTADGADTYNTDGFRLRGMKQYWLHENPVPEGKVDKENVATTMTPLGKGTSFEGIVRFHNLRPEELGLLLWSICPDEDSRLNIGKAKAYGYGKIKLEIQSVETLDMKAAYCANSLNLHPEKDVSAEEQKELVNRFQKELGKILGVDDVRTLPAILGLIRMKDPKEMPSPAKIRYMKIDDREYQNRRPLPDLDEMLKK